MTRTDSSQNLTKRILVFVRDHWALVASVGYLYLSIMGMSQSYFFYKSFGINIFEFSELNDFALAAFKEPRTLIYGLGMLLYIGFASLLAQIFIKRKELRDDEKPPFNKSILKMQFRLMSIMVVPAALLVPIALPNALNNGYSEEWKSNYVSSRSNQAEIKVRVSSVHNIEAGEIKELSMLGTTDKYTFFYSKTRKNVLIVPISNVLLIEHS